MRTGLADEPVTLGLNFEGGLTAPFEEAGLPGLTLERVHAGNQENSARRHRERMSREYCMHGFPVGPP